MPLIAKVGRKSWRARIGLAVMYVLLTLGGITMVIPFLVMLSNSFKSDVDVQQYDLMPAYWTNNTVLTQKYLQQQCNYDLNILNGLAQANAAKFVEVPLPPNVGTRQTDDYRRFMRTLPVTFTLLGDRGCTLDPRSYGIHPVIPDYRHALLKQYGSLTAVERAYHVTYPNGLEDVYPPLEFWSARWYQPLVDRRMADFLVFKGNQPIDRLLPVTVQSLWAAELRAKVSADCAVVNQRLGAAYASLETAPLPTRVPASSALRRVWEPFVRNTVPLWFIHADGSAQPAWSVFLRERYKGAWGLYQQAHPGVQTGDFARIPLPTHESLLRNSAAMGEWNDFLAHDAPITALTLDTAETRYRAFLQQQYGTIASVNRAYGTSFSSFETVTLPTLAVFARICRQHAWSIRWEFIIRNYRTVATFLLLHGRAALNTLLLVALSLLFTLTVNPISAYALSRSKLRATNKLLLFLLATMAFPAEIAMIPNFLLLKDLHLLNTYWALLLPGMANGFSIFLLKGMFDGLPKDIYEAAELDGANESVIFARITLPLVKPFLAYLALGTFMGTYASFMFAFLLCPSPRMWTIMVYLQQMDVWASQPIQFAAFVLASIPTLIVFMTCQNIIMRGIVLPSEK